MKEIKAREEAKIFKRKQSQSAKVKPKEKKRREKRNNPNLVKAIH